MRYERTVALIGEEAQKKLNNSRVLLFGVGGVGGHALEALVRAGVGGVDIVDGDVFSETNLNRQIFATEKTLGRPKVLVAKERLNEINSTVTVNAHELFFKEDTPFDFSGFDYVIDAVDDVGAKMEIVKRASKAGVKVISAMGAGNKLGTEFIVADIYKTDTCPLARVMRAECRKAGVQNLKVVYSKELPVKSDRTPSSISFVPASAGLVIASEVVKDLISE